MSLFRGFAVILALCSWLYAARGWILPNEGIQPLNDTSSSNFTLTATDEIKTDLLAAAGVCGQQSGQADTSNPINQTSLSSFPAPHGFVVQDTPPGMQLVLVVQQRHAPLISSLDIQLANMLAMNEAYNHRVNTPLPSAGVNFPRSGQVSVFAVSRPAGPSRFLTYTTAFYATRGLGQYLAEAFEHDAFAVVYKDKALRQNALGTICYHAQYGPYTK